MAKRSAAARGQYFKAKTKKWLEALGYTVAHLERMLIVRGKPGLFVKRDQMGADLLAVNESRILFVQVKGGASWKTTGVSKARTEFGQYPCPPGAEQWIVVWPPRARQPNLHTRRGDQMEWR